MATTYTVKSGDTLSKIGGRLGVDWRSIASANNIKSPYIIRVGQRLTIPSASPTVITPPEVIVKPQVTVEPVINIPSDRISTNITPRPMIEVPPREQPRTIVPQPQVTVITPEGGTVVNTTTLDKLLGFGSSITALLTKQPYVPTTVQPVQQRYEVPAGSGGQPPDTLIDPNTGLPYGRKAVSTGDAIQKFLEENSGFILLLGIGAVLFLVKPPKISRGD